jgi:hypothetical protein
MKFDNSLDGDDQPEVDKTRCQAVVDDCRLLPVDHVDDVALSRRQEVLHQFLLVRRLAGASEKK